MKQLSIMLVILQVLFSSTALATEKVCVRYENVTVEECTNTRLRNAAGGAVLGGLAGWVIGGKKSAGWGALGGGAVGAISGDKKCTTRVERYCSEYKELTNANTTLPTNIQNRD